MHCSSSNNNVKDKRSFKITFLLLNISKTLRYLQTYAVFVWLEQLNLSEIVVMLFGEIESQ